MMESQPDFSGKLFCIIITDENFIDLVTARKTTIYSKAARRKTTNDARKPTVLIDVCAQRIRILFHAKIGARGIGPAPDNDVPHY